MINKNELIIDSRVKETIMNIRKTREELAQELIFVFDLLYDIYGITNLKEVKKLEKIYEEIKHDLKELQKIEYEYKKLHEKRLRNIKYLYKQTGYIRLGKHIYRTSREFMHEHEKKEIDSWFIFRYDEFCHISNCFIEGLWKMKKIPSFVEGDIDLKINTIDSSEYLMSKYLTVESFDSVYGIPEKYRYKGNLFKKYPNYYSIYNNMRKNKNFP